MTWMPKPILIVLTSGWLIAAAEVTTWGQTQGTRPRSKPATRTAQPRGIRPTSGRAPAKSTAGSEKPARPTEQPLLHVDPRLDQILIEWETKSAKIKKLSGNFKKIVYDEVFAVEQHGDGEFYYEAPDKGAYEVKGINFPKGTTSKKTDKQGNPFQLGALQDERWVCTGKEIYQIDDAAKKYRMVNIPPESQGKNIIDGPLPFLFGMKAEQAKRRYYLQLHEKSSDKMIWLIVKPRFRQDAENYQLAEVMLDPKTFLPTAVRTIDPTGNKVTVHTFPARDMNVNPITLPLLGSALKPNLKGYQQILEPTEPPDETPRARISKPRIGGTTKPRSSALPRTADAGTAAPQRRYIPNKK
jgi:TIGR03009 family protein